MWLADHRLLREKLLCGITRADFGLIGADGVLGTGHLWKDRHELLTVVSEILSAQPISLCSGHGEWLTKPVGWG